MSERNYCNQEVYVAGSDVKCVRPEGHEGSHQATTTMYDWREQ